MEPKANTSVVWNQEIKNWVKEQTPAKNIKTILLLDSVKSALMR